VGHSGGGPLVQLVAEGLPERVTATVFVDAWVLLDGETINDVLPDDLVAAVTEMAKASPDNTVPMPVDLWRTAFMQDGSEDLQRAVEPRLVPTPFGWFDEPVELRRFGSSGIPSGYVFLEQDQAVPPDIYQAAAARLNSPRIATSPGSHEAMLTRPRELAQALLSVLV
jgi:pimeloyl-ACP methyl ester carboxylesterase